MIRRSLETFGAGWVVYVVMAACSASEGRGGDHVSTGGVNGASNGGTAGAVGGGGSGAGASGAIADASEDSPLDAIADALTDPVEDADANESGTRLKARRYLSADGAKQFIGWRDTQRNEDCSFYQAEDAVWRCLPLENSSFGFLRVFQDAACTVEMGAVIASYCKPKYGAAGSGVTCTSASYSQIVYELGAQLSPANYYVPSNGTCIGAPASSSYKYYAITKVPANDFAEASIQIDS